MDVVRFTSGGAVDGSFTHDEGDRQPAGAARRPERPLDRRSRRRTRWPTRILPTRWPRHVVRARPDGSTSRRSSTTPMGRSTPPAGSCCRGQAHQHQRRVGRALHRRRRARHHVRHQRPGPPAPDARRRARAEGRRPHPARHRRQRADRGRRQDGTTGDVQVRAGHQPVPARARATGRHGRARDHDHHARRRGDVPLDRSDRRRLLVRRPRQRRRPLQRRPPERRVDRPVARATHVHRVRRRIWPATRRHGPSTSRSSTRRRRTSPPAAASPPATAPACTSTTPSTPGSPARTPGTVTIVERSGTTSPPGLRAGRLAGRRDGAGGVRRQPAAPHVLARLVGARRPRRHDGAGLPQRVVVPPCDDRRPVSRPRTRAWPTARWSATATPRLDILTSAASTWTFGRMLDTTPPTISIASPVDGARFTLGQVVTRRLRLRRRRLGPRLVRRPGGARRDHRHGDRGDEVVHRHGHRRRRQHVDAQSARYEVLAGSVTATATGPAVVSTDPGGLGASPAIPVQTRLDVAGGIAGQFSLAAQAAGAAAGRLRRPADRGRHVWPGGDGGVAARPDVHARRLDASASWRRPRSTSSPTACRSRRAAAGTGAAPIRAWPAAPTAPTATSSSPSAPPRSRRGRSPGGRSSSRRPHRRRGPRGRARRPWCSPVTASRRARRRRSPGPA